MGLNIFSRADRAEVESLRAELESTREELQSARLEAKQCMDHLHNIPTPIMAIDREFTITYMNSAGARIGGLTPEQCLGKKCYDLFKTPHCQTPECRCSQAMSRNEVIGGETVVDPQGLNIPIQYTGAPIKDDAGNIVGALEYVVDITETKKAMDDAQEKVDFLNEVPTPVMVVDKEFTVRFMNRAGAAAVAKTQEQVVGMKCFNLFNTGHCNTADCQIAKAMRENGACTSDTVAKLPSGDLPIRYTGAPLKDAAGNIVGGVEYVTDISKEMDITHGLGELTRAAHEGRLDERADVEKFQGNYRSIVQGVNDTIDVLLKPITEASGVIDKLAEGDLTAKIVGDYQGDHSKLKDALNGAIDNLARLVGQVSDTSDGLAASKDQLSQSAEQAASATQDVAKGAAQVAESSSTQSTSAVEVNKAFEALAQSIEQIVKGSEAQTQAAGEATSLGTEVTESAQQMTSTAEKGVATVEKTIAGMTQIRNTVIAASEEISRLGERSTEIGKIVSVIDDIAAQTNLLALNAAIEAARAGEQGRGFAVVAEEVRSLAERVAAATKEIADLIGGVQESVTGSVKAMEEGSTEMETGSKLASEAGDEMQRVLAAAEEAKGKVEQITAVIGNISAVVEQNTAATQEMKAVASQVGTSIEAIASIAQENNATTEEVSASAQEMSSQVEETTAATHTLGVMADDLRERVSVFRLGGDGNGRQAARSVPVHPDGGEELVSTNGEGNEEAGKRPRAARSTRSRPAP